MNSLCHSLANTPVFGICPSKLTHAACEGANTLTSKKARKKALAAAKQAKAARTMAAGSQIKVAKTSAKTTATSAILLSHFQFSGLSLNIHAHWPTAVHVLGHWIRTVLWGNLTALVVPPSCLNFGGGTPTDLGRYMTKFGALQAAFWAFTLLFAFINFLGRCARSPAMKNHAVRRCLGT